MEIERIAAAGRKAWDRAGDGLLAAGLFAASLFLYLQTLAPSMARLFDDSLEFPLVAHRLGIAHPTGYPLYTLLAKLFSLGPGANVAWAVNFFSAVTGALAVALVYLAGRELARRRFPALLGAVFLAISPVFWSQAVVAEVYTLNTAFVAGLLWLALRWARQPLQPVRPFSLLLARPKAKPGLFLADESLWLKVPAGVRRVAHQVHAIYRRVFPAVPAIARLQPHPLLYVLAVGFGLSLTHHRTTVLLIPALFVYLLLVERRVASRAALLGPEHPDRPRWRQIAGRPVVILLLCLLVPLLLYLYLPLRGGTGSLDGTYANTWRGFWSWVLASGYGAFLGDNPLARNLDAAFYGDLFWQQFGPVGLALAVVGLFGLARKPKALALTGLAFATYVAFAVVYRVPDVEVFFLPAFLIAAVWIGAGLDFAMDLLRIRGNSLAVRRLLAVCGVLLLLAALLQPVLIAARHYADLDLSRRWTAHDYGRYLLQEPLPWDSTVIGLGGEMNLLRYFQDTSGGRTDIETIIADDEDQRLLAVEEALARGRTVFVTRSLPGLAERYALDAVTGAIEVDGDLALVRVGQPDGEVPDLPRTVNREIAPGLELLGYGVREHHGHWQGWARLRLWWRAPDGLEAPFQVSARLVDAGGQVVATTDAGPVAWTYPANAWRPGEVVADAYEIPLPAGLPPGDYVPLVIVYDPGTGAEWGRAELEPVSLQGSPVRPPQRALEAEVAETVYARFGDVELLGYTPPDPETAYAPGGDLPLSLLWQARGKPAGDLRVAFWLEDVEAVPLGEEPAGGRFAVDQWADGQVVRQWPALRVPDGTPSGIYRLLMRVTRDGQPVPWSRGLLPAGSDLELGRVQVGQ